MATITLRIVKGSELTYSEIDANFFNINQELVNHIADTDDAHDASAISYAGSTNVPAGNVESAIDTLGNNKAGKSENNTYSGTNNFDGDVTLGYDVGFTTDIKSKLELGGELGKLRQVVTSKSDGTVGWSDYQPRVKKLTKFNGYINNCYTVLLEDGTLRTWGYNNAGQCAQIHTQTLLSTYHPQFARSTTPPPPTAKIVDVYQGHANTFILYDNGWVYGTGINGAGQLGLSDVATRLGLNRIDFFVTNNISITKISCGTYDANSNVSVMFLTSDGRVYLTGNIFPGNGGAPFNTGTPIQLGTFSDATDIMNSTDNAGQSHWVIRNGGELWVTGYAINGNLGINSAATDTTNGPGRTFQKVQGITGVVKKVIPVTGHNTGRTVYYGFTLALTTDGKVWATGYNVNGQLGLGDTTQRNVFNQISALNTVNIVDIEANHCGPYSSGYAISNVGKIYSWGYGASGTLGDGTLNGAKVTPSEISGTYKKLLQFGSMPIGAASVAGAIDSNDNLIVWGYFETGAFGTVASTMGTVALPTPSRVYFPALEKGEVIVDCTGLTNHNSTYAFVLTNYGRIFSAGYNVNGELGYYFNQSRGYSWKQINLD